jgi:4-alpha-glucanotransferase
MSAIYPKQLVEATTARAAAWGVAPGYHAIGGRWVAAEPERVSAILDAMGAGGTAAPASSPVLVVRTGETHALEGPAEVVAEDGRLLPVAGSLPADLPAGYHTLRHLDLGTETRLIVSPGRCRPPATRRAWGWAVQLYAARSRRSWGVGDLADLRDLARWAAGMGAGAMVINPLDAVLPVVPQEASPYYPSSRRFRNPLYIRVEEVPGAAALGERLAPLAEAGQALNARRLIDRDAVHRLKMVALEDLFATFAGSPDLERYLRSEGRDLTDYATFCAIAEMHGSPWQDWPAELRHPRSDAVCRFGAEHAARVRFHEWLQWLLDRQLAAAASEIGLVHDLPIGAQAGGADAWAWQDVFAPGVTVGAPPDPFNEAGQNWALPPFDPWRLRSAGYEPFVRTLRAAFRHGAGLRIDHVMGLFRLFWIPAGSEPRDGLYVRYPHRDLLDILALESERAGAFVVGEDLGTVEDAVRDEMAERRLLSYRLLWFEDRPPASYPPESLAALTTHDLPTLAGIWEGSDPDPAVRERLRLHAGVADGAPTDEVAEAAYRALAASPSRLLAATLEDALGVPERPNRPGTTTEWPNWSLALPLTVEELITDPRPPRIARALSG